MFVYLGIDGTLSVLETLKILFYILLSITNSCHLLNNLFLILRHYYILSFVL